jgi:PAS domain-containing protein
MEHMKSNKNTELGIEDALIYAQSIINIVHDPVIILKEDLRVAVANRSFYQVFEVKAGETEGEFIYELGNSQWNIPKLRELLEEILPKATSFDDFEVEHDFPHIGKKVMLLNACRIYLQVNHIKLIIITIRDITDRRKIEELKARIKELEAKVD